MNTHTHKHNYTLSHSKHRTKTSTKFNALFTHTHMQTHNTQHNTIHKHNVYVYIMCMCILCVCVCVCAMCNVQSHHGGEPERVQSCTSWCMARYTLHRATAGCITQLSTSGKASRSMALYGKLTRRTTIWKQQQHVIFLGHCKA